MSNTRKVIAIILIILLVGSLTLAFAGKFEWGWFWLITVLCSVYIWLIQKRIAA